MESRINERLNRINTSTLIIGIDIAKNVQWARFIDYRGVEVAKVLRFENTRSGFERLVARIMELRLDNTPKERFNDVIIGMEPTGHYWKPLAHYLLNLGYEVVCVNPFHTKKAKELDDNSQTKNDKKDALTIARLVKDGRYFGSYMPTDIYAELRVLSNNRESIINRNNAVKNTITAIMDEYFPEIWRVFKCLLTGKAARQVLKSCPFPNYILELGETGILAEIKTAVKKTVGVKKIRDLIAAAKESIGVTYGLKAAKIKLRQLIDELEMIEGQLEEVETAMESALHATGYADLLLSIKGVGVVTAARFLGEVGDPLRFENPRQIARYAGFNLVEDSSGKSKSGTVISKRGRSRLRSLLYQMAFTMVGKNAEMKALHKYLTTREKNPLKKKQSLVVISKKIITVIYSLLKKRTQYVPELVLGSVRREMMNAA